MKDEKRINVAKEAARLLYYRIAEDYKSAKITACHNLNLKTLPSNYEVAVEFDNLAEEMEGHSRRQLLINMREEALLIMDKLQPFYSKLIGSVWRGTARQDSDLDITVYSESKEDILDLIEAEYANVRTEEKSRTSEGGTSRYFHIYFDSPAGYEVEIVIRRPEMRYERRRCEIYGDYITGLTRHQLREILKGDAAKRFLPEKRNG